MVAFTLTTELDSCENNCIFHRNENVCYLALYKKCLLTTDLEDVLPELFRYIFMHIYVHVWFMYFF